MSASAPYVNDRVTVNLKTLVDLAKPAASLRWSGRQIRSAQVGNYLSRFKGRGMVFAETRLYQAGDDVRRMDWRVTARTNKPHSKIFCEERERPLFICVDYRPSMQFATRGVFKSVQAAKLAALLAWRAHQQGDRVGGQIFSAAGCQELKPRSGKVALMQFFNAMVQPVFSNLAANTLETALARLQHHAHPGSRVSIISDFRQLTSAAETYLALLARHCEVDLLHVHDSFEVQLPTQGRYRLTDQIKELIFDSSDRRLQQQYAQQFQQRQARLRQLSLSLRLRYLSCSTQDSPQQLLNRVYR